MVRNKVRHIWVITGRNEVVAMVMFLLVSVILLTGGVCLSACWDTTPPGSRPPWSRHPRSKHPPPPWEADSGIRSMSGRYASYWNAFLSIRIFPPDNMFSRENKWERERESRMGKVGRMTENMHRTRCSLRRQRSSDFTERSMRLYSLFEV